MKSEFTAVIEEAPEGGFWAICPEIPEANGQGETVVEAKESLIQESCFFLKTVAKMLAVATVASFSVWLKQASIF